jgi:hypothetical protein
VSRTDLRALLAIAAAAFALRAGAAVLTEFKPIFPDYYYTDAVFVDHYARETVKTWELGLPFHLSYAPPQRVHIWLTALVYHAFGAHQILAKLLNALAAAAGVGAFGLLAGRLFAPRAALAAAALMALWPSHVFYTSQNFKEGLLCGIMMGAFLLLTPRESAKGPRPYAEAAAGAVLLAALGFLRSYVMLAGAAAFAAAAALAARSKSARRAGLLAAAACLLAPLLYKAGLNVLLNGPLRASVESRVSESVLIPKATSAQTGEVYRPLSPRGITEFRRSRQYSDRQYAKELGHEIGTQIYPEERMDSWLDVLLFIPKSAFHVLFMPLPGLYPMDGKRGRMLAAAENLILLAVFGLGAAAALRGVPEPRRLGLLLFFAAMTAGSSLLEFDLGSAGRHKLMFLPMLFPFAAEEALRRVRSGKKS